MWFEKGSWKHTPQFNLNQNLLTPFSNSFGSKKNLKDRKNLRRGFQYVVMLVVYNNRSNRKDEFAGEGR